MKKILIFIIGFIALFAVIGGCGDSSSEESPEATVITDSEDVFTQDETEETATLTEKESAQKATTKKASETAKAEIKTTKSEAKTTEEKSETAKETTESKKETTTKKTTTTKKPTTTKKITTTKKVTTTKASKTEYYNSGNSSDMVWIPESGKKYHSSPDCSNMKSPSKVSKADAIDMGYGACKKCY